MSVDRPAGVRDPARLAALRRFAGREAAPDEACDRLARVAARAVGAVLGVVALADETREFFGGPHGDADPLHAFARSVVAPGAAAVAGDARDDLAAREVDVAAYVAAPLESADGHVLGVLCVADREPRGWTDAEVEIVHEAARAAAELVELAATNARALLILESIGHAFLALDENEEFVYLNAAAERLLARPRAELLGRNAWSEFPDLVGTPFEVEMRRAISLGEPLEFEACYEPADIWFAVRLDPAAGGVSAYFRNVTKRKRLEEELERSREEAIYRLARAIALRSAETGAHVERIASYSALVAARLGLDERETELLRIASQLHDVGKIGIPDDVLLAARPLDRDERALMETHTLLGHSMLTGSGEQLLELAATIALTHHERPDGKGYPRRLHGDEIGLPARIVAVADVFDALTSERVYRDRLDVGRAVDLLLAGRGTQFDPGVLDAFLESLDDVVATLATHEDE